METKILRISFMGYKKEDVLTRIDELNELVLLVEEEKITRENAEKQVNRIMLIEMQTAFNGFSKDDTDKYLAEFISKITNKEYQYKYNPDYAAPTKQFFTDTWKVLLAIFIVTATWLYILIFDGSEMPAVISTMTCIVLLTFKALKAWIDCIKLIIKANKKPEKSDIDKDTLKTGFIVQTAILAFAVWFLANIINIGMGG